MNDAYEKLRKPLPQILGVFSIFFSFFGWVQYFYGLTIKATPLYLIISSLIIIATSIICFIILACPYPKNHEDMKKSAFKLMVLDILVLYCLIVSIYNAYFFLGANMGIDLAVFWGIGISTMIICLASLIYGIYLLSHTPYWLKSKKKDERVSKKIMTIIIAFSLSLLVVFQNIIEYFTVPNINGVNSVFLFLAVIMPVVYFVVLMLYIHYTQVLSDYELEDADKFFE
ncbi:hypothetical protein ACEE96_08685 [Staphylococcus simulans]